MCERVSERSWPYSSMLYYELRVTRITSQQQTVSARDTTYDALHYTDVNECVRYPGLQEKCTRQQERALTVAYWVSRSESRPISTREATLTHLEYVSGVLVKLLVRGST